MRGRFENILAVEADALAFEESKKGFSIELMNIAEQLNGKRVLLGNLDSINILQEGTQKQLKEAIEQQLTIGKRNKHRFIMSLGSPVTPQTSVERVALYCELATRIAKL